jgi:HSP20 family protein
MRELEVLRRELDRALTQSGVGPRSGGRFGFLPGRGARQYPLVNVYDDGVTFFIEALAPGVDPGKLEVSVVRNRVTIEGEKTPLQSVAPERVHRSERATGRFVRTVDLPADVEAERVSAQYRNGLLLLAAPRAESARPRKISIQSA